MGKEQRGIRTGTGAYKNSFRRIIEKKEIGRRLEEGETCPINEKEKGKIFELKDLSEIKI